MLNIGMTELLVFGIIALLILGPDKLPEAVRFVSKWYHKIKRMVSSVQNDLERELRISELRIQMQEEMQKIHELELKMQNQLNVSQVKDSNQDNENIKIDPLNDTSIQYQFIHQKNINIFHHPYKKYHVQTSNLTISKNIDQYKVAV